MRDLRQLRPGLWRWTAPHPAWRPGAARDSAGDWPQDVGCVAYATGGTLLLVDPLVPDDGWPALDTLVDEHGPRVHVLTTIRWHRRSRADVVERYGAQTSRAKRALPTGVETVRLARMGETMVWLPGPRALVPGDRLIGGRRGGLRVCPQSWMPDVEPAELRAQMAPLLELPIEMVLVSHGRPVLRRGRQALARALATADR